MSGTSRRAVGTFEWSDPRVQEFTPGGTREEQSVTYVGEMGRDGVWGNGHVCSAQLQTSAHLAATRRPVLRILRAHEGEA